MTTKQNKPLAGGAEARDGEQKRRHPLMLKLKLTMAEVKEVSNEALPLIYKASLSGDLKTFLVGRRRFARPADVEAWVDFMQRESDAGRPVKYQSREQEREQSCA